MHLTVLGVPGCPNAPVLKDRLEAVLEEDRRGVSVSHEVVSVSHEVVSVSHEVVSVSHEVVSDDGTAARRGMHGSPTLLIEGVDPFAEPGQSPSISCRLYRDENGQPSGAPSVGQLRQAIERARAATAEADDPTWLPSVGREHAG